MYGDFFLKIWKARSQVYPGIFNFRAIIGKNHFTLQEVNIHSTNIYLMPLYLGTMYVLEGQRHTEVNVVFA